MYAYLEHNKASRKELIDNIFKHNEEEFQQSLEKEVFKTLGPEMSINDDHIDEYELEHENTPLADNESQGDDSGNG